MPLGNLLMIVAKIQSPGILPGAMSRVEKEETWLGASFPRVVGTAKGLPQGGVRAVGQPGPRTG